MECLPEALYGVAQTREIDRRAAQLPALADGALMERAGAGAFGLLRRLWPRARRVAVVCGPGNNGGDGYVLARCALQAGLVPEVMYISDVQRLRGDTARARDQWLSAGGTLKPFGAELLAHVDLVVDAIFGTGLEREVQGEWLEVIAAVNACGAPVLSLDLPSGLHADTGRILGAAVRAAGTVTFIGLKVGMFTGCGREQCGRIYFDGLALPPEVFADVPALARRITPGSLHGLLHPRPRHVHKGDAGRVLVVGGQPGMGGAARLAGEAAYRVGAGLVTIATHPLHAAGLNAARPELMVHAVSSARELRRLLPEANIIAIGPGLGQAEWGRELFAAVLDSDHPVVVDADALNLLAANPVARREWVLTPHPGEAGRLLGCGAIDIQADRLASAHALADRFSAVCVLKGSGSLVTEPATAPAWLCDAGNPGMASGGTGDVLTGIIAGLLAQGLKAADAARLGVWCHARAGDEASAAEGERGLMAGDLLPLVRSIVNSVTTP